MSTEVKQQIQQLDEWIDTNPDSRELKRAIAVKLALQGWTYRTIRSVINVSYGFISTHKSRFQQGGIEGLKLAYQGGHSFLTSSQKQQTLRWLTEKEAWDISELECYLIEEFDVVFKSKTREFFKEINGDLEPQDWRITCHLLAPYAPEENPIEEIWLSLKTLLRGCCRFCKNFSIMKKIFELLAEFKLFNFPNLRNYDAFSGLV